MILVFGSELSNNSGVVLCWRFGVLVNEIARSWRMSPLTSGKQ